MLGTPMSPMILVVSKLFGVTVDSVTRRQGACSSALTYAPIAAMSRWIPMMFIVRVRL